MQRLLLLATLLFCCFTPIFAQNTVGLLSYDPSQSFDGYNLMFPHNQPNVYLLDNCGEIVHVWEDDDNWRPGNIAYLLEDGNLVKGKRDATVVNDPIWAGGGGAILEIRDWDNNLLWDFELNNDERRLHHDFAPMPNGNILAIAWELKTAEEAIQAGRDPENLPEDELWPDYIFEINPDTDEIVWEWYAWDHLIQDIDATKDNFGDVGANPQRIDINYDSQEGDPDWLHSNAIDYNEELDQILLCVPHFDEVWIIDHSTSTEEAAGSIGGAGGRGGDLLYRWGNPLAYKQGTEDDKTLFFAHDAHWVNDFLPFNHPFYNQIAVFNNRVGEDFSTVNIFNPPWDMYSWGYDLAGDFYGPFEFGLTITHPVEQTMLWSTGLSSVQILPNDNTLITAGRFGYTFEVTPDGEIVWEYKTPFVGGAFATQGDTLTINNNLTFRMKRFPADFSAFEGRDLSSKGWIELEPDSNFCDLILPVSEAMKDYSLELFPNPTTGDLTIEWLGGIYVDMEIFNLVGVSMKRFRATGGRMHMDISDWPSGVYVLQIGGVQHLKFVKE